MSQQFCHNIWQFIVNDISMGTKQKTNLSQLRHDQKMAVIKNGISVGITVSTFAEIVSLDYYFCPCPTKLSFHKVSSPQCAYSIKLNFNASLKGSTMEEYSMEALPIETISRNANCQVLLLNFH
jgi:hypothetical protein